MGHLMESKPRKNTRAANTGTYAAPALEKGFNVVELLASEPEGLTISEIAVRLGHRNISEIFRVIIVMERRGWVERQGGTDRVRVTYKVLELAFRATPARALVHVAAPLMYALSAEIDQSCHLVVVNRFQGLVIHRQENPGPTGFAVKQGAYIDLLHSCSGTVLMAFSDDLTVAEILQASSPLSDPALETYRSHLRVVRERGYELIASARTLGVTDMSCPVFNRQGEVVAALTLPFMQLIDGSQKVHRDAAREILQTYAARITQGLGGQGLGGQGASPVSQGVSAAI